MDVLLSNSRTGSTNSTGRLRCAHHVDDSVRREQQLLADMRGRCFKPEEAGHEVEAILEQIAIRRVLLAQIREIRERLGHQRSAALNMRPRRRGAGKARF